MVEDKGKSILNIIAKDLSAGSVHTPETQMKSMQWHKKGMPGPLKVKVMQWHKKGMLGPLKVKVMQWHKKGMPGPLKVKVMQWHKKGMPGPLKVKIGVLYKGAVYTNYFPWGAYLSVRSKILEPCAGLWRISGRSPTWSTGSCTVPPLEQCWHKLCRRCRRSDQ
jgi:hypothetical protein